MCNILEELLVEIEEFNALCLEDYRWLLRCKFSIVF